MHVFWNKDLIILLSPLMALLLPVESNSDDPSQICQAVHNLASICVYNFISYRSPPLIFTLCLCLYLALCLKYPFSACPTLSYVPRTCLITQTPTRTKLPLHYVPVLLWIYHHLSTLLYHWLIWLYSDRGEFPVGRALSHSPFLFSLVHSRHE